MAGVILQMWEIRTLYRIWESSKRGHLRDLGADARIITKQLLEVQSVKTYAEFYCLKVVFGGGHL